MLLHLLRSALLKAAHKKTIAKHPPLALSVLKIDCHCFVSDGKHRIILESEAPYYSNIIANDYEF